MWNCAGAPELNRCMISSCRCQESVGGSCSLALEACSQRLFRCLSHCHSRIILFESKATLRSIFQKPIAALWCEHQRKNRNGLRHDAQYPERPPQVISSMLLHVSVLRACVQSFKSLVECVAVIFRPGGERVMIGSFACLPYW
jgi:hypothetical protein